MRIAVNTPNGNIGRVLTETLLDGGADVVLLTRSPDKAKPFEARGATIAVGDLADADFVTKATKGVDALFWLTPGNYETEDLRGHQKQLGEIATAAVKTNGIPRVMVLSSVGAQHATGVGPIGGLHDVEKMLDGTDAKIIHLRPAYFMENYFMSAESIAEEGNVYLAVPGETQIEMIATKDIATTAAELLQKGDWERRAIIELGGPDVLTFAKAAEAIGEGLGREVSHVEVQPDQAREAMRAMGIKEPTIELYLEMQEGFKNGRVEWEGKPRRTRTTLTKFARETLGPALSSMG